MPMTVMMLALLAMPMLGSAVAQNRAERPDDLTGTWDVAAKFSIAGGPGDGQTTDMKAELKLVQRDAALTGTFVPYAADGKTAQPSLPLTDGRVNGSTVTFRVKQSPDTSLTFTLVLADGHLRGDAVPSKDIPGGGKLTITVDATRKPK